MYVDYIYANTEMIIKALYQILNKYWLGEL